MEVGMPPNDGCRSVSVGACALLLTEGTLGVVLDTRKCSTLEERCSISTRDCEPICVQHETRVSLTLPEDARAHGCGREGLVVALTRAAEGDPGHAVPHL